MYDFFRRYNKSLMAFFGVILMIAFLMPTFQVGSAGASRDRVVGAIGSTQIHASQVLQAEAEWEFLASRLAVQSQMAGPGQYQSFLQLVPPQLLQAVDRNPTAYLLLQEEARQMGLTPPVDEVEQMLASPEYGIVAADRRILPASQADPNLQQAARAYLANFLMVWNAYQRGMSVVKISEPLIKHEIAQRLQQIKVQLVDFQAKDYADKVPAATTEQLQKHFDQYASIEAGAPATESNPFAFGYKYPNRVKLQYIAIPREEVRKAVKAAKSDYDWEVEAQRYYQQNQGEFPTTAPAATQESMVLLPTPRGPTTKPFAEVRDTILSRVIEPLVDRMQLQIQSEIVSRLNEDYHAYDAARGPSTAPATQGSGAAYESFEYLQKLASAIQTRHKVTITIVSVADSFKTEKQLAELKDISQATNFAALAVASAEPFVNEAQRTQPPVLSMFEPSRALTDMDRNVYIYRLTAAEAAHPPASLEEVREKVEADWKRLQAFELAKQDAQKLLDAANEQGLEKVAGDKLITTGPYSASNFLPIDNYKLSTDAQTAFVRETYALLGRLNRSSTAKPVTLVPMPADERIAVAELIAVESGITEESAALAQSFLGGQIRQQYASALASGWFAYPSIVDRLGYKDLTPQDPTMP